MKRAHQAILIVSILLGSWLGMQGIHELGHVLGAWVTGGRVAQVVWHPLTISRTDLAENPSPLATLWAGPVLGAAIPLILWGLTTLARMPHAFLSRFFAGFCLIANGAYIGFGAWDHVGDAGEMLRHGSPAWQLLLFGLASVPAGLLTWHRQGPHFGLGLAKGNVSRVAAYASLGTCLCLIALSLSLGMK